VAFYTLYGEDMKPWDDTLSIDFDALPGPEIDFGDINGELNTELPHVLDAGAGHRSYLWQNGSTNQTYTVTANGIYTVTVTGQNDCRSSKTVRINMPNGTGDTEGHPVGLVIYPNPNQGVFNIKVPGLENQDLNLRIFNNQGQMVYDHKCSTVELENDRVEVQQLPRGIYYIVIYTKKQNFQGKMIIQ